MKGEGRGLVHSEIKDTLNKGHLSNEAIVCISNHIELYTDLPLK